MMKTIAGIMVSPILLSAGLIIALGMVIVMACGIDAFTTEGNQNGSSADGFGGIDCVRIDYQISTATN